jgi:hypothetical protein
MSNTRPTQCDRILEYIEKFGSISTLEAFVDLGVCRLASRICELRKRGLPIVSEQIAVKNRFDEKCYVKKYSLAKFEKIAKST